jgi:predicted flap endonuclease-1-like 5' DNA nuclease
MIDGTDTSLIVILVAALAALIAIWLVWRGTRRRRDRAPILTERSGDERPYLRTAPPTPPPAHAGLADEISTATTDVVGDVLSVDCHMPDGARDNLQLLKGVGPKLAARLGELGITGYAQLAGMGETEVAMLDERLGPFSGRVARDRLVEQAQFLARGDTDGFEARFGKLGGEG